MAGAAGEAAYQLAATSRIVMYDVSCPRMRTAATQLDHELNNRIRYRAFATYATQQCVSSFNGILRRTYCSAQYRARKQHHISEGEQNRNSNRYEQHHYQQLPSTYAAQLHAMTEHHLCTIVAVVEHFEQHQGAVKHDDTPHLALIPPVCGSAILFPNMSATATACLAIARAAVDILQFGKHHYTLLLPVQVNSHLAFSRVVSVSSRSPDSSTDILSAVLQDRVLSQGGIKEVYIHRR